MHSFTGCKQDMLGDEALQPGPGFASARKALILKVEGPESPDSAKLGAESPADELSELSKALADGVLEVSAIADRLSALADSLRAS